MRFGHFALAELGLFNPGGRIPLRDSLSFKFVSFQLLLRYITKPFKTVQFELYVDRL